VRQAVASRWTSWRDGMENVDRLKAGSEARILRIPMCYYLIVFSLNRFRLLPAPLACYLLIPSG
jgi:hypothetical protein